MERLRKEGVAVEPDWGLAAQVAPATTQNQLSEKPIATVRLRPMKLRMSKAMCGP